jgi:AraC-like DNA-binding protein
VITKAEFPEIYTIAGMIVSEMEKAQQHYHHIVRELFGALFLMLLRTFPNMEQSEGNISTHLGCLAPAIVYITENYMNNISVDQLAELCHVSTSHFRRLFKKSLGWSPLDYLQIIRIDHACKLLYNCESSITEISMQVGYPSTSSFNRQFRRIHGVSPNHWRQKMRAEENPAVTAYFDSLPPSVL